MSLLRCFAARARSWAKNVRFSSPAVVRGTAPQLSVVVICHEMRRELRRTLQSLSPAYQQDVCADQYEVIVVENGSKEPFDAGEVQAFGSGFSYVYLPDPPPSPAFAINFGVARARGDIVCIMVDGACLLTPGVLANALRVFQAFPDPLLLTRYFYLGPGIQNDTIKQGYNQDVEDSLLASIRWPDAGYRLFEIGTPLPTVANTETNWFHRTVESNCTLVKRKTFLRIGGCDLRFDIPGGGLVNHDLLLRIASLKETTLVHFCGEGTFHQVHGGTTTNTSATDRDSKVEEYKRQYERIRGGPFRYPATDKPLYIFGRMRSPYAITMKNRLEAEPKRAGVAA